MIRSFCRATAVLIALLAAAAPARAADPNYAPGRGGIGGAAGISYLRLDRTLGSNWFGDFSDGAQPRMSFAGQFRYVARRHWRWQVSPGFLWTSYRDVPMPFTDPNFPSQTTKDKVVTLVLPVTAQLQYTLRRGWWIYHAGAGAGIYRVWVEDDRKVLRDPVSLELIRKVHPGFVGQIGAERFLTGITDMSVEFSLVNHLVFAKDTTTFPSGFNSNLMATALQIGVNYYFDPGRRAPNARPPAGTPSTP